MSVSSIKIGPRITLYMTSIVQLERTRQTDGISNDKPNELNKTKQTLNLDHCARNTDSKNKMS